MLSAYLKLPSRNLAAVLFGFRERPDLDEASRKALETTTGINICPVLSVPIGLS